MLPNLPKSCVIVGLGHKARQGKDTVAGMLIPVLGSIGFLAKRYSFAGALYDHCRTQHGMGGKDAPLLQRVGADVRERDPMAWIRAVAWKIHDDAPDVAIVTDLRYRNEAETIREAYGGLTIRVMRLVGGRPLVDPTRPANHPSETDLDGWQWNRTVVNEGDVSDLLPQVLQLAADITVHHAVRTKRSSAA